MRNKYDNNLLIFQVCQLALPLALGNKVRYIFVNLIDNKVDDRLLRLFLRNNY